MDYISPACHLPCKKPSPAEIADEIDAITNGPKSDVF